MPRISKEERIRITEERAKMLGLPDKHAAVLARVSFRRNLDTRVNWLMRNERGYGEMIKLFKEMSNDPVEFYFKHKSSKYPDHKKFIRYGNLSFMYSNASPIQLIHVLLEDAKKVRAAAKLIRVLDEVKPTGEEYDSVRFEESRFGRLEQAFRQDLFGNGIPKDLVERVLEALKWDKRSIAEHGNDRDGAVYKTGIMDAFYIFFSSPEGNKFLKDWNDPSTREDLISQISYRICNDPKINPQLIDKSPKDIGTPAFEERCRTFGNELVFNSKGLMITRSEIDTR
ncbi:MAG: hypothetical protein AABX11_07155 [Nanoarchaeota archaeon]